MAATSHRLVIGSTFAGRFRIEDTLGEGAMGTVYIARTDEGICALKVLKASVEDSPKAGERFSREAMAGQQIGSPHVVAVYGTGLDADTGLYWLSMEVLEGESLDTWLDDSVPERSRLVVLQQIFEAMADAHRAGVIHRDLKPENIMVTGTVDAPVAKLLDFGVAKTFRPSLGSSSTEGGLGTPLWAAPEQGRGGVLEPSVDVWSLGLLTFYLLTGKVYWRHFDREASLLDLAMEMLQEPIAPASERAAALGAGDRLPQGFDAWFSRAVTRELDERFPTADEALDALLPLIGAPPRTRTNPPAAPAAGAATGPPSSAIEPDRPPARRRKALWIVVAAVVLAAIAVAVAL